jgi:malonyl-CoA/methylmalonyl-CoA synthetase
MPDIIRALPLFERMINFSEAVAIVDDQNEYSYRDILTISAKIAAGIKDFETTGKQQRFAILLPSGIQFVSSLLAIWRAGHVAVPLSPSHTTHEWEHMIDDCGAIAVVTDKTFANEIGTVTATRESTRLDVEKLLTNPFLNLPTIEESSDALIIYTSGTTSKPKGVVHTHQGIRAQIEMLVQAWQWNEQDSTLNCLPLHHVHGLVNVLLCGLWSGAKIELMQKFSAEDVWSAIDDNGISLFMAVPTIYSKLVEYWQEQPQPEQKTTFSRS